MGSGGISHIGISRTVESPTGTAGGYGDESGDKSRNQRITRSPWELVPGSTPRPKQAQTQTPRPTNSPRPSSHPRSTTSGGTRTLARTDGTLSRTLGVSPVSHTASWIGDGVSARWLPGRLHRCCGSRATDRRAKRFGAPVGEPAVSANLRASRVRAIARGTLRQFKATLSARLHSQYPQLSHCSHRTCIGELPSGDSRTDGERIYHPPCLGLGSRKRVAHPEYRLLPQPQSRSGDSRSSGWHSNALKDSGCLLLLSQQF